MGNIRKQERDRKTRKREREREREKEKSGVGLPESLLSVLRFLIDLDTGAKWRRGRASQRHFFVTQKFVENRIEKEVKRHGDLSRRKNQRAKKKK